jgi:tetratricopeptide (TPR) repeat protein
MTTSSFRNVFVFLGLVSAGAGLGCNQNDTLDGLTETTQRPESNPPPAAIPAKTRLNRAVVSKHWDEAETWIRQALLESPDDPKVFKNAAVIYGRSGRKLEAAEMMAASVDASGDQASVVDVQLAFQAMMDAGRFYDAAELLERSIKRMPDQATLRRNLVGFYGEAELPEQAMPHVEYLIRQRAFDLPLLKAWVDTSYRRFSQTTIELLRNRNPDDWRIRLGEARSMFDDFKHTSAIELLDQIIVKHPDFGPAHALLGRCLLADGRYEQLPSWHSKCPDSTQSMAMYWLTIGDWSIEAGDAAGAARAYGEAVNRDANDAAAWSGYAAALRKMILQKTSTPIDRQQLDRTANAAQKRFATLLKIHKLYYRNERLKVNQQASLASIAGQLLQLGRLWEAEAWSAVAMTGEGKSDKNLLALREQIVDRLQHDRDWQVSRGDDAFAIDIMQFPAPSIMKNFSTILDPSKAKKLAQFDTQPLPIRLVDQAKERGVSFFGRTGDSVSGPHVIFSEMMGCGGGCIDFDRDGQQDLILMAAGGSFRGRDSEPNRCYRNLDGQFADVTQQAGSGDTGFGQGVAVGDINDDGFSDTLMLNLGLNRILQNNGDGTFTDVSDRMGKDLQKWSVSGAIIDVNGDTYNDIFVVNYCDADSPIRMPCFDTKTGALTSCFPLSYPASPDDVYLGLPTGGFRLPAENVISCESAGRGLGIVAGNLDSKGMSAYIANDMSANNYFPFGASAEIPFGDTAYLNGLAVLANTQAQASMGMAAGDFDHDGDLDFFVTGYVNEYNVYYEQETPGMWVDRSIALGLANPPFDYVGFGTQAIDLDNDGLDELLVTNGHVGEFGDPHQPYAQQFRLFRRSPDRRYQSENVAAWEGYFSKPHVGRAMWRGDLDQDGRTDAVITHATEPVSLLMNRSASDHHRIGFRLVATDGPRDAVGATVRFEVPAKSGRPAIQRTLFRLAGDGYMATNEDVLRAGTGQAGEVKSVSVTWPSGQLQSFGDLSCGRDHVLVQGHAESFEVNPFQSAGSNLWCEEQYCSARCLDDRGRRRLIRSGLRSRSP